MTQTVYDYLTGFEDVGGDMMVRLETTPVRGIFQKVSDLYPENRDDFNKVLFYILYAYSPESHRNFLGWDWMDLKLKVAEKVGIEKGTALHNATVFLEDKTIIKTAYNYLLTIGAGDFKHLCMLKDLYEEMLISSVSPIKKPSEEIDYDQKKKNSKYATELWQEIKDWELRIMGQDTSITKAARDEVTQQLKDRSLNVEDNLAG